MFTKSEVVGRSPIKKKEEKSKGRKGEEREISLKIIMREIMDKKLEKKISKRNKGKGRKILEKLYMKVEKMEEGERERR